MSFLSAIKSLFLDASAPLRARIRELEWQLSEEIGARLGAQEAAITLRSELETERTKIALISKDVEEILAAKDKEISRLDGLLRDKDEELGRFDALLTAAQLEIEDVRAENIRLKGGEQLPLDGIEPGDDEGGEVVPLPDEIVSDLTHEMAMAIVRLSFRDRNVWHFSQGEAELSAEIQDKAFLERMHARAVAFADGDVVRANVRTTVIRKGRELTTRFRVLEVLEIIPPPRQLEIAGGGR